MRAQSTDGRTVEIVQKRPDPERQSVILVAENGEEFVPARHGINIVPLRSLTEEPTEQTETEPTGAAPSSEEVVEEEPREPTPRRKKSRRKPPAGDGAALGGTENGGQGSQPA